MDLELRVCKRSVMDEVAKTTAYAGQKQSDGDEGAYDRIFATDADREMLERFWHEGQIAACEQLKKVLLCERVEHQDGDDCWVLCLRLSSSFDGALANSMEQELCSYFVMCIVGKWFAFCNKQDAGDYGTAAKELLLGVHKKALYKRKPVRPVFKK